MQRHAVSAAIISMLISPFFDAALMLFMPLVFADYFAAMPLFRR